MDLLTFTKALFGLGHVPVEFELRGLDKVGKKYEYTTEQVYVPYDHEGNISDDLIDKAVSGWEHNGWAGSRRDCKNHHKRVSGPSNGATYNVCFCRWIDVEEEG